MIRLVNIQNKTFKFVFLFQTRNCLRSHEKRFPSITQKVPILQQEFHTTIGRNLLLLMKMIIINRKGLIILVVRKQLKVYLWKRKVSSLGINCTNCNLKTNKINLFETRVLCFSCFNDLAD